MKQENDDHNKPITPTGDNHDRRFSRYSLSPYLILIRSFRNSLFQVGITMKKQVTIKVYTKNGPALMVLGASQAQDMTFKMRKEGMKYEIINTTRK